MKANSALCVILMLLLVIDQKSQRLLRWAHTKADVEKRDC